MMRKGLWKNGKRTISGEWRYARAAGYFVIRLNQRDRTTGELKTFRVYNDTPEWGNWKRVHEEKIGA